MDRSSQQYSSSSSTHPYHNNPSARRGHNSQNRPKRKGRRTSHRRSYRMDNARGNSIQFNGTANVRTLIMTGPEPASPAPANRVVDLPAHTAQISNDDGGGVTGVRMSGSPRAGNNPQQRDAGLNGEPKHAAGPNIAPAPAPAPAQPPVFGNVRCTHAARSGSSKAGYHQQPQDTETSLSYIDGHTVEQTHAPGPNIGCFCLWFWLWPMNKFCCSKKKKNNHSIRRGRNSENRPTPYETGRRTSHRSSHRMDNAGGNSNQFNGTTNIQKLIMIGSEPASPPPANRVVDLPALAAHAARPPSSGTRHCSAQISNDDGGGVTGVRISGSPRAGNNPQQRDAGLNGEPTHAAGPNIAPAPAPAQPPVFGTHAARSGSSKAGYHQQPQDTGTYLSFIDGHTVEQTHLCGEYPHLAGIDHFRQIGGFASSAQMNAVTPRPDGVQTLAVPGSSTAGYLQPTPYGGFASSAQMNAVPGSSTAGQMNAVPGSSTAGQMQFQGHPQLQTNAVPGSSTAGHLQPTTTAPSSTVAQQHSPQLWDDYFPLQDSEKRF